MSLNRESLFRSLALMALLVFAVAGCKDGGTESAASPDASPDAGTAALAAPANLRVAIGADRITLRWDPVAGAEGYRVYWNQSGQVTVHDAWLDLPDGQLSYLHRDLLPGQRYHYRLAALGGDAPGQLSAEIGVILPDGATASSLASDRAP